MTLSASIAGRRAYFALSLAVLVVDQASKIAADLLLRGRDPVRVIPGFFSLWYSRNRGGLFGYFAGWEDPWRSVLLTVFPLLAIAAIAVFLVKTDEPDRRTLAGLAAILGGALGNLIDRAARGEVVDFLDAYVSLPGAAQWLTDRFGTAHWPTFNLADSAIVVGAGLLLLDLFRPQHAARPAGQATGGGVPDDRPRADRPSGQE
jgi:signal peptidase II